MANARPCSLHAFSRRILFQLLCLGAALPLCPAAAQDAAGWNAARWGMSGAEIERAWPRALTELSPPREYSGAYAALADRHESVAGLEFTAYFQMNEETGRLQQVLLERRRPLARPADFQQLLDGLSDTYGDPVGHCLESDPGSTLRIEFIWHLEGTVLHASFLDFSSIDVLVRDPALPLDTFNDLLEERLLNERTMPRRILLRAHPAERTDLAPPCR